MSILDEIVEAIGPMEYPDEPSKSAVKLAKESNCLIVFGASDDLIEFRGAFEDEGSCCDGGTFTVDDEGILPINEDNEFEDSHHALTVEGARALCDRFDKSVQVTAIWTPKDVDASWAYELPESIPHATFDVIEDDELYCRGVVFQLPSVDKVEGLNDA